ncbi:MAG: hypothetical protein O7D30_07555, partial [Rickettsia endosymbiont of Ixodes persulcatus]|nr:hypothetical protein [Rickettsia endosymbiont of Ixodes persulcatus]
LKGKIIMMGYLNSVASSVFGSPKQERVLKNINDFLTEYFHNLFKTRNNQPLTVAVQYNALEKFRTNDPPRS